MTPHRRSRSRLAVVAAGVALVGLTLYQGPAATAAGSTAGPSATGPGLAFEHPGTALGGS
jgi:hypothetical protein